MRSSSGTTGTNEDHCELVVDDDDVIEVITIRDEDLVEVDETEGLGVVSGMVQDETELRPRTSVYAVPPMPPPVPPAPTRRLRWTPQRGITSQPDIQIGVMARGFK
jgi:hypothetical protein